MGHRKLYLVALGALLLLFCQAFYVTAWVVDDAYITFRTVDNLVSGYGMTWNPAERVQSFSHPLWMLLLSAVHAITGELFYSSLALSFVLCVMAVAVVVRRHRAEDQLWKPSLLLLLIIGSKSVMDFASSGLENPLS